MVGRTTATAGRHPERQTLLDDIHEGDRVEVPNPPHSPITGTVVTIEREGSYPRLSVSVDGGGVATFPLYPGFYVKRI